VIRSCSDLSNTEQLASDCETGPLHTQLNMMLHQLLVYVNTFLPPGNTHTHTHTTPCTLMHQAAASSIRQQPQRHKHANTELRVSSVGERCVFMKHKTFKDLD